MTQFPQYGPTLPIAIETDTVKYRQPGETFEQSIQRVSNVTERGYRSQTFDMLADQRFLPAGRIRAAVGTKKKVTAFNCYVMEDIPDDLAGIMDVLKQGALTMKQGGGTGYDFSGIRPKGSLIKSLNSTASGPVSYMHIFNSMCATISSAGHRRGAMMFVLRVDHPDIEEYIEAKTQPGILTNANLSIAITDEFMQAVELDTYFTLQFNGQDYEFVKARDLWDKIMRATWDWAEPGVLFIDRINEWNNLFYTENIKATNPCAEQPLPAHGACLLGSFNLVKYIKYDLRDSENAYFDFPKFIFDIPLAVRLLDNIIDSSIYPLHEQEDEAHDKRRMGIGVTGVANALEALGYTYGSAEFLEFLSRILEELRNQAYISSSMLAEEKGVFPLYDGHEYLKGKFIQTLPEEIRDLIADNGMRNSHLLSIAPTGTISLSADNISSGIEPVFSYGYTRTINMPDGVREEYVEDYGVRVFGVKGKTAMELTTAEHVNVLAVAQKFVDSAVSKTINVGEAVTFDEFKEVYLSAYRMGAKGATTFRPAGKRLGILVSDYNGYSGTVYGDRTEDGGESIGASELPEVAGSACVYDASTGRRTCD